MPRGHKPKKRTPSPTVNVAPQRSTDLALAKIALDKLQRGDSPTAAEATALRRHEDSVEERRRWEYYRTIPQKHWLFMAGGSRQCKTLQDQARRFLIPIDGKIICLPDVVRSLHDFFAKNKHGLTAILSGKDESAADAERRRKIVLANLDELRFAELRKMLIDRAASEAEHRALLNWFSSLFDRAAHELPPRLNGRPVSAFGQIIKAYLEEMRGEIIAGDIPGPAE